MVLRFQLPSFDEQQFYKSVFEIVLSLLEYLLEPVQTNIYPHGISCFVIGNFS